MGDIPKTGTEATDPIPVFDVGTKVYVCDRFLGNWTSGFEVVEVLDDGYRLRRLTDGRVFSDVFQFDDVRGERRDPKRRPLEPHFDRRQFP
jgi:hypothetical protein